jgi:phosphomevalonate kinase
MAEATAPGKLLLTGEYAVLAGAPAVAVAVDVRARARSWSATGPHSQLVDQASGQSFNFSVDARGRLAWLDAAPPAGRGRLLTALMQGAAGQGAARPPFAVSLDTGAFQASGTAKLGLGSSAAGLVALAGALARPLGWRTDVDGLSSLCLAAHRAFQAGRGSGVDVLTALHGGLIGVRPGREVPSVRPLAWPAGIHIVPVWSGRSADTTAMIARFEASRTARPEMFARHLALLTDAAEAALAAFGKGSATQVLAALDAYGQALAALDRDAGLGIHTPEHQRLRDIAVAAGAVYKTSGAGGGDLGFAATDSVAVVAMLQEGFSAAGFRLVSTTLPAPGLSMMD